MNFEQKISESIKKAMIAKDRLRLDALRSLRAAILDFQKSGSGKELDENEAIKILNNAAKKRRDAIEMYQKGQRQELADKEKGELEVIKEFLPKQLSDNELRDLVKTKIDKVGAESMADFGKVMGPLMGELSGKVDGKKVKAMLKEILG